MDLQRAWLPIPPITFAILLPYLAATYLDTLLPEVFLGPVQWAGFPLVFVGCFLSAASARLIYAQEEWNQAPSPLGVPRRLIIEGPYSYVRNPMLLGIFLIILGEGLFFQSPAILSYLLTLFLGANYFLIPGEERRLDKHFGEEYRRYKARVGRWIPGWSPYKG